MGVLMSSTSGLNHCDSFTSLSCSPTATECGSNARRAKECGAQLWYERARSGKASERVVRGGLRGVFSYISSTSEHFAVTRSWIPSFVLPWKVISAPLPALASVSGA